MKQKNDDNEVVTRGILRSELKRELKIETNKLRLEIDEKAKQYHDEILTRFDGVMKELEDSRENRTLEVYQTKELRDQAEDHERRIIKLERAQKAA